MHYQRFNFCEDLKNPNLNLIMTCFKLLFINVSLQKTINLYVQKIIQDEKLQSRFGQKTFHEILLVTMTESFIYLI